MTAGLVMQVSEMDDSPLYLPIQEIKRRPFLGKGVLGDRRKHGAVLDRGQLLRGAIGSDRQHLTLQTLILQNLRNKTAAGVCRPQQVHVGMGLQERRRRGGLALRRAVF